jgi:alkaline phosphatase D
MATYDAERAELLKKIADAKVPGVFFLTGDRHHTCLQKLERAGNLYPLYDLTISPLTSGQNQLKTKIIRQLLTVHYTQNVTLQSVK